MLSFTGLFVLLYRMTQFNKLSVVDLPRATEHDIQQMRKASKTAFIIFLIFSVLSFLPYAFFGLAPNLESVNYVTWTLTLVGLFTAAGFDFKAENIKKRGRSETAVAEATASGELRWYHVLVAIILPYVGLPWGIINLVMKRRKSGMIMTLISGFWIAIVIAIVVATSSHAK